MLNRNDYTPLYVQLQNIIRNDIMSGKYKDGEMIPSEAQMMKLYDVTRTTIRKAVADLVNEGLLVQAQGKGIFVTLREVKHNIWNFSGFTDYANKKHETPISHVIEHKIETIDGESYLKLVRTRGIQNASNTSWLTIDHSLIPLAIFPGIDQYDFSQFSLYSTMMDKYKVRPHNAMLQIIPIIGDATTKSLLQYEEDTPLLKAVGTVYSDDGVIIEKVEVIYGPNVDFKMATTI